MRRHWLGFAVVSLAVCLAMGADNKPKPNKQEEQREKEREQQAEQEVKAAREKLEAAQKSLAAANAAGREAVAARQAAAQRMNQAKEQVATRHEGQSGLIQARQKQAAARTTAEQAAGPVLAALKATVEYISAVEQAGIAKQQLAAGAGTQLGVSALQETILKPSRLEQAAIEANPAAKAARAKLTEADAAVAAANKKLDQLIESDSALSSARKDLAAAVERVEAAERKAQGEQRDVAAAAQKVNQANNHLSQVKAANRRDDQQDKNKKNDKKGKGK